MDSYRFWSAITKHSIQFRTVKEASVSSVIKLHHNAVFTKWWQCKKNFHKFTKSLAIFARTNQSMMLHEFLNASKWETQLHWFCLRKMNLAKNCMKIHSNYKFWLKESKEINILFCTFFFSKLHLDMLYLFFFYTNSITSFYKIIHLWILVSAFDSMEGRLKRKCIRY